MINLIIFSTLCLLLILLLFGISRLFRVQKESTDSNINIENSIKEHNGPNYSKIYPFLTSSIILSLFLVFLIPLALLFNFFPGFELYKIMIFFLLIASFIISLIKIN